MRSGSAVALLLLAFALVAVRVTDAFTTAPGGPARPIRTLHRVPTTPTAAVVVRTSTPTQLQAQDLDVIALVAGQENYGLAVVAFGEGLYSFVQEPSLANIKVLIGPTIAALILVAVSGPMITSGDAASTATGLWIATAASLGLAASYVLRLLAPPYETLVPKEVASVGLLVAVAGFFSFGQNLIVNGFLTLPSIPLPQILPMPPSDNFAQYEQ